VQAGIFICLLNGNVFTVPAGCSIAQAVKQQVSRRCVCEDLINSSLFYLILRNILFDPLFLGMVLVIG
jgi:hypothetical protein